ncbi:hypothetical protein FFI94_031920 [Rhodococcus sp. KBS0724]|uniref:hypothetical protein n=1 Tax=Rhodococcus sp. KBS0724 TaxID=1179674 RepID=UPI00110E1815|nr:hypothetical protein [Rhodococcus sp. KBS0724]TSD40343.1 hypothetical protein FFI94_031920 [Rhodococcus sp. KBS0724]
MLSSPRRIKKGPGRRPLSDKRRRFMELRGREWSIRAAAREVGVSRSSGTNWARDCSVYRAGQLVRTVAPLDRLGVRAVSARFLSEDERIQVADLQRERPSTRQSGCRSAARHRQRRIESSAELFEAVSQALGQR